ncbi:hypothetical protein C8J56DRAFT_902818 [Mycena floridula]|nr:hypothetical protein C8J56DRAFT_902818 [Mycena floridula]
MAIPPTCPIYPLLFGVRRDWVYWSHHKPIRQDLKEEICEFGQQSSLPNFMAEHFEFGLFLSASDLLVPSIPVLASKNIFIDAPAAKTISTQLLLQNFTSLSLWNVEQRGTSIFEVRDHKKICGEESSGSATHDFSHHSTGIGVKQNETSFFMCRLVLKTTYGAPLFRLYLPEIQVKGRRICEAISIGRELDMRDHSLHIAAKGHFFLLFLPLVDPEATLNSQTIPRIIPDVCNELVEERRKTKPVSARTGWSTGTAYDAYQPAVRGDATFCRSIGVFYFPTNQSRDAGLAQLDFAVRIVQQLTGLKTLLLYMPELLSFANQRLALLRKARRISVLAGILAESTEALEMSGGWRKKMLTPMDVERFGRDVMNMIMTVCQAILLDIQIY